MLADAPPDADLLRHMRAGDVDAMSSLYQRHQATLYRFALLRSGSSATAADVVQDVFLALIEDRLKFDPMRGALSSFLMGVARNFMLKRDEAAGRFSTLTDDDDESVDIIDESPSAYERVLGERRAEIVRTALTKIAPHYRDVLVLYELQDLSYVEIAEICHIDIGTVRSRLSRGREKLAALLKNIDEMPSSTDPSRHPLSHTSNVSPNEARR